MSWRTATRRWSLLNFLLPWQAIMQMITTRFQNFKRAVHRNLDAKKFFFELCPDADEGFLNQL